MKNIYEVVGTNLYKNGKRIAQYISVDGANKGKDRLEKANKIDHRIYEIWHSGFVMTGNSGNAQKIGKIEADSFQGACDKLIPTTKFADTYNSGTLSVWACGLYDNEKDARESFG